ncbi:MAG TPA: ABC transporter permease, partial [Longimicrobiales bacterium]
MSASERAFGYALRLVPRSFRERHGDEMRETHGLRAAEMAESAMLKRAAFVLGDIWSVVWLAVRLRTGAAGIGRVSGGRKVRRAGMLDGIGQDVRFGARALRRSPGYAWLAVVVLALGIGASTAIFSAVNAFFFRPLPFADPDRLVMLYETNPEFDWTDQTAAPANYLDWREQVSGFTDIAAYSDFVDRATYVLDGEPVLLTASAVTGNFFDVLGIRPLHGRGFRWEETWAGTSVVVLS